MKKYTLFSVLLVAAVFAATLSFAVPTTSVAALPAKPGVSVYVRDSSATLPLLGEGSLPGANPEVTYACSLVKKYPADWTRVVSRYDFDAKWTLRNTGTYPWRITAIDYAYRSGTRMHKYLDRYDIRYRVNPGYTTDIVVDMIAPKAVGTYSTTWGLMNGSKNFCSFNIYIVVR